MSLRTVHCVTTQYAKVPSPSEAFSITVTSVLFQPAALGDCDKVIVVAGAVWSLSASGAGTMSLR